MGMKKEWTYRRGDIYLANLNPFKGSEQGGKRPVVVLQNKKRPTDTLSSAAGRETEDGLGGAAGTDQDNRQMPGAEIFWQDPGRAYEGNQQNHKNQHGDHPDPEGLQDI